MNYEQSILYKSMMYLMKNHKAKAFEADQAESYSPEFETLFKENWPFVYRLLYRLVGDPAEAEDLALETFYRLHQQYSRLSQDINVGGTLALLAGVRAAGEKGDRDGCRSWPRKRKRGAGYHSEVQFIPLDTQTENDERYHSGHRIRDSDCCGCFGFL